MKEEQLEHLKAMYAELNAVPYEEETKRNNYRKGIVAYLSGCLDGLTHPTDDELRTATRLLKKAEMEHLNSLSHPTAPEKEEYMPGDLRQVNKEVTFAPQDKGEWEKELDMLWLEKVRETGDRFGLDTKALFSVYENELKMIKFFVHKTLSTQKSSLIASLREWVGRELGKIPREIVTSPSRSIRGEEVEKIHAMRCADAHAKEEVLLALLEKLKDLEN